MKKYAVVCSSHTGNTAQLADVLAEVLPQEDCLYFGASDEKALAAPMIFVGFWTDKGRCDVVTSDFLNTLKGKTVFLFGTAGFGESLAYFEKILDSAKELLDASNNVVGSFMCQGKMPISVLERYEKMLVTAADPAKMRGMIENFHSAAAHPNQADFDGLKLAAHRITA